MTNEQKLERALEMMGKTHTIADIREAISLGTMQSFVEGDSWAITQICLTPRKRIMEIILVVGEQADLDRLYQRVISFAKETQCSLIRTVGRLGWKPQADKHGWKIGASVYLMELT